MTETQPLLAMRGVSKSFGAVQANDKVDLTLHRGDILGLLGENGAGKTTLMNVLFGAYAADAGTIEIDGEPVAIHNSADAIAFGVGMVHQHFHLVPRHSVIENIMVGQKGRGGLLDRAAAEARLAEIGREYDLNLAPDTLVGDLTIGEQQRLEIIKALFRGARILILDEPTAVLTPQETEGLFRAVRALADKDMGVIFISHKLYEVREITKGVMIMRHGVVTATLDNSPDLTDRQLGELMCGHELTPPTKPPSERGRVLLSLEGIRAGGTEDRPVLKDVSLNVHAGEIVGIAGVSGNGQRELADLISGVLQHFAGRFEIDGRVIERPSVKQIKEAGIGRVPEDRMGIGLITTLPLSDSMVLPRINGAPFSRYGVLSRGAIRKFVTEQIERFSINTAGVDVRTGTLSGGNLQKALLARELAWDPLVLLVAQPTRGIDIGATEFVHRQFLDLRARGRGLLVISEDLEELFTLSDRIAVIYEGRIMAVLPVAEATAQRVGLLMAGYQEEDAA
ncbi:MAG: ABC transporter ATP-binding protein [Alphaproteobacteria bacterium]